MLYVLSHVASLAAVVLTVAATGTSLERIAFPGVHFGVLRPLVRALLGIGAWIGWLFVLAASGWLSAAALIAPAAAAFALAGWLYRRPLAALRIRAPAWSSVSIVAAAGLLFAPFFVLAIAASVSWDAATYHLTLPRLFVAAGGFRDVELSVYAHWPLNVQLLYAGAMLIHDYALAKSLHLVFGVLVCLGLWLAASGEGQRAFAWIAPLLFLANPIVAFELQAAYVDLAQAFLLLTLFLLLERAARARAERAQWLIVAGLAAGVMAGIKPQAAVAVVGVALAYAFWLRSDDAAIVPRRELWLFLTRFCVPAALLLLPWLVKAWLYTGNPVYPLLHDWLGGPDWSASLTQKMREWHASIGMGRTIADYLRLPLRVIVAGGPGYPHFDGELGRQWLVAVPVALVFGLRDRLARRALAIAGLYFVFWAATSQQMRFLIPMLPFVALATGLAVARMAERAPAVWRARALAAAMLFGVAATLGVQAEWLARARVALPRYARLGPSLEAMAPPGLAYVNESLPADARILFMNTNHGFFCEREYLADSFFEASQIAAWLAPARNADEIRRLLDARAISHLLYDARDWGIEYPAALASLLRDDTQVELLMQSSNGRIRLFALR